MPRSNTLCRAVMLALCLIAVPALQAAPITDGSQISWSVDKAGAGSVHLTVTGPNGFQYSEVSKSGISLSIFDEAGYALADGLYKYTLVRQPAAADRNSMNAAEREQLTRASKIENIDSGIFRVVQGAFMIPSATGEADVDIPRKDQQILDDLIVAGSACVGQDCNNGESFGFDTLRLKENNLRIHFDDTSNSASFPSTDWRLEANDTSNGGQNRFSIVDASIGRAPFTVEGGAPADSLYVDDGGRVGLGRNNPVVELHITDGDTPTLRLEQDGSSGFTAQTFDVAANEANFFVRDATHGSRLVLKIKPNAPTSSIFVEGSTGDIGLQTENPTAALHVRRSNGANATLLTLDNDNSLGLLLSNRATTRNWAILNSSNGNLVLTDVNSGVGEFSLERLTGDLTIAGDIITASCPAPVGCLPDYVFEDDYDLMELDALAVFLDENGHLPNVPSAGEVEANGLNMTEMQVRLLEKVEELTLYTLQQHETIKRLEERLEQVEGQ